MSERIQEIREYCEHLREFHKKHHIGLVTANLLEKSEYLLSAIAALQAENAELREVRPDVRTFAAAMEQTLRKHDDGQGWENEDILYLLHGLGDEYLELLSAVRYDSNESIMGELVDVANFCMMLYCNLKRTAAPDDGKEGRIE